MAFMPLPDPIYTRKHDFIARGGCISEWDERPPCEWRPEGGLQGAFEVGDDLFGNGPEEVKGAGADDDDSASFELPEPYKIAWFGVYEPEIDDDGHFHFEGSNVFSRPSSYDPLVRMHLVWSCFLAEYALFKREQEDTSRKLSSDSD